MPNASRLHSRIIPPVIPAAIAIIPGWAKFKLAGAVDALEWEISSMLKEWMEMTDSDWVFPSTQDSRRPIAQPAINKAFGYACERAGISAIGFHALRYTFGTRLGEAGERLEVIAELMGHSKIELTRIYVHPSLGAKKQAVRKALVTYWSQEAQKKLEEKAG